MINKFRKRIGLATSSLRRLDIVLGKLEDFPGDAALLLFARVEMGILLRLSCKIFTHSIHLLSIVYIVNPLRDLLKNATKKGG